MKVEIEVPDGIIRFLKDIAGMDDAKVQDYIENAVESDFGSSWDAFLSDPRVFIDTCNLIDQYDLMSTPTLKGYIKKDC